MDENPYQAPQSGALPPAGHDPFIVWDQSTEALRRPRGGKFFRGFLIFCFLVYIGGLFWPFGDEFSDFYFTAFLLWSVTGMLTLGGIIVGALFFLVLRRKAGIESRFVRSPYDRQSTN